MKTNDKIKALKEQTLDWIEKQLSSDNPVYIPEGIEDAFLEEDWEDLELYLDCCSESYVEDRPLANIIQEILNEVRLQEFRKKRGKQ